jgi:hypothetical protein
MQTAFRTRIKDAVGTAPVHWGTRPQQSDYPAVVIDIRVDALPQHMGGFQTVRATLVRVHCFALTWKAAKDLQTTVLAAAMQEGTFDGVTFQRPQNVEVGFGTENTETGVVFDGWIDLDLWHNG